MFIGIEIGGTKLQIGVGPGDGSELIELVREDVVASQGAAGILGQIKRIAPDLIDRYDIKGIGIGFGGPVDTVSGKTFRSFQIDGWENFALATWIEKVFQRSVVIGNDCDVASLAEANFGAGKGKTRVFYITVGTGIGGGFVINGRLDGSDRPTLSEIGHMRPGVFADQPDATVEAIASGWGISSGVRAHIKSEKEARLEHGRCSDKDACIKDLESRSAGRYKLNEDDIADLLMRCHDDVNEITAKMIAQAAAENNGIAVEVLCQACRTLGWAIAQVITILAPQVIVIGGGVSLMGEHLFFDPIKREVAKYVFSPLAHSFEIVPAKLGEWVVVHGALALAAQEMH